MSSAVSTLPPSWPETVPAMFRPTAEAIEKYRQQLRGDPAALRATASTWRTEADNLDAMWRRLRGAFLVLRDGDKGAPVNYAQLNYCPAKKPEPEGWQGASAEAATARTGRLVSELATVATSLRFAAQGTLFAAESLTALARHSDASIRRLVADLRLRYEAVRAQVPTLPPDDRRKLWAWLSTTGREAAEWTLQEVSQNAAFHDHLIGGVRDRFILGPDSPWREHIADVVERKFQANAGSSVTVKSIRGTQEDGIIYQEFPDGRVVVHLTDEYRGGGFFSHGAKLSFDKLPEVVRAYFKRHYEEALKRHYGEAEIALVGGYSLGYSFASKSEAEDFISRLNGRNFWEWGYRRIQALGGNAVGPFAEFGPWFDRMAGKEREEVTLTVGWLAKGRGEVGVWPMASLSGAAAVRNTASFTPLDNGFLEVSEELSFNHRLLGQAPGVSLYEGSGFDIGEGQSALGAPSMTTVISPEGETVSLEMSLVSTKDLEGRGGTLDTYVGLRNLGRGAYVKALGEEMSVETMTYSIDLTANPEAGEALVRLKDAQLGHGDKTEAYEALMSVLREYAVVTRQIDQVDAGEATLSARVGFGGISTGVKMFNYSSGHVLDSVNSGYVDPTRTGEIPSGRLGSAAGDYQWRPLPRDNDRWQLEDADSRG